MPVRFRPHRPLASASFRWYAVSVRSARARWRNQLGDSGAKPRWREHQLTPKSVRLLRPAETFAAAGHPMPRYHSEQSCKGSFTGPTASVFYSRRVLDPKFHFTHCSLVKLILGRELKKCGHRGQDQSAENVVDIFYSWRYDLIMKSVNPLRCIDISQMARRLL